MTNQNAPDLRLEGFNGEWNDKTLFEVASFNKGTGYSKADIRKHGMPLFLYGRLYTKYELAVTDVDTYADIQPGSVVSTGKEVLVPASGETPEDIAIACALLQEGVILGGDLNIVKPHPWIDSVFLALSISHGPAKAQLVKRAQGKSVVHVRIPDIATLHVAFPPTLEEQQAIGDVFAKIDASINQHQDKHRVLQRAKTSLLQRMFPQDGASEPELRLEGFGGPWISDSLGEMGTTYGGLSGKSKDDFGHGEAKYVTYMDIFTRAVIGDAERCGRVELDPKQHEVAYGDVLFTTSSEVPDEVGQSAVWLVNEPNVYLNSFCFGFRPTTKVDERFLGYALKSPAIRNQITMLAQGISRFNISKKKVMEVRLLRPEDPVEQRAIGNIFTKLDNLITAEAHYVEKLTQAKTALLKGMFVDAA